MKEIQVRITLSEEGRLSIDSTISSLGTARLLNEVINSIIEDIEKGEQKDEEIPEVTETEIE